ncbi:hypothetical protein ACX80E_03455 [Arthrobacter sp. TMN-49]
MSAGELTGEQILALLHELANRLAARGIHGDIKLVGGAALILPPALFSLIGVTRMDLLEIDHVILNVEPDARVTLEGWFVLPSLMGGTISGHNTQITS